MIFKRLGDSGLQVPIISLGGWLTYGAITSTFPNITNMIDLIQSRPSIKVERSKAIW
jgi:hypothetical protein